MGTTERSSGKKYVPAAAIFFNSFDVGSTGTISLSGHASSAYSAPFSYTTLVPVDTTSLMPARMEMTSPPKLPYLSTNVDENDKGCERTGRSEPPATTPRCMKQASMKRHVAMFFYLPMELFVSTAPGPHTSTFLVFLRSNGNVFLSFFTSTYH